MLTALAVTRSLVASVQRSHGAVETPTGGWDEAHVRTMRHLKSAQWGPDIHLAVE